MPDFHRLNKTKTAEMSREELNERLKLEAEKAAKNASRRKRGAIQKKQQEKISQRTKSELPPISPERRRREEERRRAAELERKNRKRRRRGSYIVYYIMIGIILVVTLSVLSVTVFFNVEHINIIGESEYTDEQIIEASGLEGNENLIKLDLTGVDERILEKLVRLDTVKVAKSFPSSITITVTASKPMACYSYAGKNYIVSYSGRIIDTVMYNDDLLQVVGYKPEGEMVTGAFVTAEDKEQDELISKLIKELDAAGLEMTRINIADKLSIVLTYEDRVFINIGSPLQIDEKLTIAKELLFNGYVDENETVNLDISSTDKARKRPVTEATTSVTTTAAQTEPPEEQEAQE